MHHYKSVIESNNQLLRLQASLGKLVLNGHANGHANGSANGTANGTTNGVH